MTIKRVVYLAFIGILLIPAFVRAEDAPSVFDLSLKDLLNTKVITASREEETLDESPALIEIITQDDIQRRGYKDLSYIFDDIAGVQVSRGFGDNYFNTIWRGQRYTIGSSYLILIDGVEFNHLYYNESEILATFPLSNIKYIEVVHGAASVAYGNDAVVGVVNIITVKERNETRGFIQYGDNDKRVIDMAYQTQWQDYRFNFSGRYDQGNVDFSNTDGYRWTNTELLFNRDIWGVFANRYSEPASKHFNVGINSSIANENSELSLQYYQLNTGNGLVYTFDHAQPNARWKESEFSLHYKQQTELSDVLLLKTLMRYRASNVDSDSYFIESYLTKTPANELVRLVDFSYWESKNYSKYVSAELSWQIQSNWDLLVGSEFEFKNLQKAYNINFGPSLPPEQITDNYPFPSPPVKDSFPDNRKNTNQKSLYLLNRYDLYSHNKTIKHKLHFGLRVDKHSVFGTKTTIRTGWVGLFDNITLKLFYGEAYQEPSPRLLYGGWQGSGSDPNLKPRNSNTWEFNANYKFDQVLLSANLYRINSSNLFNTTEIGAINIGEGKTDGGDIRIQYRASTQQFENLTLWTNFTWLNSKEQVSNSTTQLSWQEDIDISNYTLHFGGYFNLNKAWQLNIRGRYYGDRNTVLTNELSKIKGYTTLDTNLIYKPQQYPNLRVALGISNLFNQKYFHPGLRSASANNSNMGEVNDNGVWIGSESFYNAKIPQPAREFILTLSWKL